jgi:two-component system sensor histidine kinase KdpD
LKENNLKPSDNDNRPNPDVLLKAVQREEEKEKRGKLKVFLGMAAGVGKTYSMLSAAQELLARGVDVVVGLVETHGRSETETLLKGLPIVPRSKISYRNVELQEMNLDAILARKPQIVLVDEAAHTNVPGSRHAKRYQDIYEIMDAGIDV